ncbi:MAG: signal peptidase II [Planctomycetota bacterium]
MDIRNKWFYLVFAAALAALDLLSKSWAFSLVSEKGTPLPFLGGEAGIEVVPGFFYLTRVYNAGGIWGIGQDGSFSTALIALRIAAVPLILLFILKTDSQQKRLLLALSLFCAGAIGNLYDNLMMDNRSVRDFLDFYIFGYHWPTFNIADSGITCGMCLLILDLLIPKRAPALTQS